MLVAALTSRTAHPRALNSRTRAVTRRLHIAPAGGSVGRGNRRATAGDREFGALPPRSDAAPARRGATGLR